MIVCVCNRLREHDCLKAADCPKTRSPACVYRKLGVRIQCGRCVPTLRRIVEEAKERHAAADIVQAKKENA